MLSAETYVSVSAGRFLRYGYGFVRQFTDCPCGSAGTRYGSSILFPCIFAWNDETQEGRYFTIERTQDPGKHLLGEFKKDWKHVDYGEAPAEGAELQRVLDIIRQPGEN